MNDRQRQGNWRRSKHARGIRTLSGIRYALIDPQNVRNFVLSMADKEWDSEDFDKYGEELQSAVWGLDIVEVQDVKERLELIRSEEFLIDLRPRIQTVSKLIRERKPIPPLILRGKDHLIFDGYARLHALRALGVKKCLAYVGR